MTFEQQHKDHTPQRPPRKERAAIGVNIVRSMFALHQQPSQGGFETTRTHKKRKVEEEENQRDRAPQAETRPVDGEKNNISHLPNTPPPNKIEKKECCVTNIYYHCKVFNTK
ncbi:hypothetical protein V6N13_117419 [Hibiscus sabdariffa]